MRLSQKLSKKVLDNEFGGWKDQIVPSN